MAKKLNLKTFPEMFSTIADLYPQNLAIQFESHSFNYAELNKRANQLSHWLLAKGIKKGHTVIIIFDRTHEIIIALLAVMKIGAVYIPVGPNYPDERIETIVADSNAQFILTDHSERGFSVQKLSLQNFWEVAENFSCENPTIEISLQDLAYVIYTSGSTGKPKGVMIAHKSITNIINWYHEFFAIDTHDTASQINNQAFDVFFSDTLPYLSIGAAIKIVPEAIRLDPIKLLKWLTAENNNITIADIPTAYAQVLFDLTWPKQEHLRILKIGGESLGKRPKQNFNFKIYNMYGPTETCIDATWACLYSPEDTSHSTLPYIPIGKPVANTVLYVVDQDLKPVKAGECGQLLIGGECLSLGYLNNEEMTAKKFISNPIHDSTHKVYMTGDLVRLHPDGNYEFIGRVDNQVKISGHRIELEEIENTLIQNAEVKQAAVTAHKHQDNSQYLVAHVVLDNHKIRLPVNIPCKLAIANEVYDTQIVDISEGGMAITTDSKDLQRRCMHCHEHVTVTFCINDNAKTVIMKGQIIWCIGNFAGIAFISDNGEIALDDFKDFIDVLQKNTDLSDQITKKSGHRNLWKSLALKLPPYMLPSHLMCLDNFTFTPNGKIDRKALTPPQNDTIFEIAETLNKTSFSNSNTKNIQDTIKNIWCEVLNHKQINVQDNFFDIGGQSILMMKVQVKLQEVLNRHIEVIDLFTYPTIASLSKFLNQQTLTTQITPKVPGVTIFDSDRGMKQRKSMEKFKKRALGPR